MKDSKTSRIPNFFIFILGTSDRLHFIKQEDLNDLVPDLNLSKNQSEILQSPLKSWKLLDPNPKISMYQSTGQN